MSKIHYHISSVDDCEHVIRLAQVHLVTKRNPEEGKYAIDLSFTLGERLTLNYSSEVDRNTEFNDIVHGMRIYT